MSDSLKQIMNQIEKIQINTQAIRQQAQTERDLANRIGSEARPDEKDYHNLQAEKFDAQAQQFDTELEQLEARRTEVEARINELKEQRETLNRETLEKVTAIDKELTDLQGSLII